MSDNAPRIYVDANIVIELAKLAKGVHRKDRAHDLWIFQQMLKAAQVGEIVLLTSTISIAECVHVEGDYGKDVQEFFTGILTSGMMFALVQDSIFVAERARDLLWKHDLKLKGKDAIHVASALDARCTEILSWDGDMNDPQQAAKIEALSELGIDVVTPSGSKLLPDHYRSAQGELALKPPKSGSVN